ncbi:iron-containing alcohol dehydrogenase [Rhizobium leguminosarum]|uniref:iron-containing alcohol dehydrogenase n=1 Tax=Rhizobium leguminosarum TaxID=384 RepID=UPI001C90FE10|nr:iron-containing alcohol dehydrogenase [Rhizobium leguminosarum]MBY3027286.1 iron-containing alcohol dehydrogenase [Rhizobium leguminosarum]
MFPRDIALTVFDRVVADPPSHVIEAAGELCRERGVDALLSIVGGSSLHTAKLVVYLSKAPGILAKRRRGEDLDKDELLTLTAFDDDID